MDKHDTRRSDLLIALVLVSLIAVAYWQVHGFGLLNYDDDKTIELNGHVQSGLSAPNVEWAFTTDYQYFRMPVVWISLMLDREIADFAAAHGVRIGPDNAGVFHLTNVLLHATSTLLLFVLLMRLTGHRYRSALVAALFAIHPLHVESVAWATERKDVLSGFFWMLTILFYTAYARRPGIARYLLTLAVFSLGLLAKPMLVTLPVLMLAMDYWPLKRFHSLAGVRRDRWRIIREKAPFVALALVASAFSYSAQREGGAIMSADLFPLGQRAANAATSYLVYARQMVWPRGLVPFYPLPRGEVPVLPALAGALWLLAASLYALRTARSRPYVLFGWLWYLISLLPVIQIVQVGSHAHADRYTYLPLIGLFVAVVWLVAEVVGERAHTATPRLVVIAISCLVICVLTALAHNQVSQWRDSVTLFEHTLRHSPENAVAYSTLGLEMVSQGRFRKAEGYLRRALEIWPDYATARNNLGRALEGMGELDEAIRCYRLALRRARPGQVTTVEMSLGLALVRKGRYSDALAHVRAGLAADPNAAGAHNNLGYVLALMGEDAKAECEYRQELRTNPRSFDAYLNLGRLMAKHGNCSEAIKSFSQAIRLQPRSPDPANSLAWLLATYPDPAVRNGGEAVSLAEFACRATENRDPSALDTLAAAYAEAGRFDEAVSAASRAAATAESMGRKSLAGQIRARLRLYTEHRAYREPRPH